jgi:O-antigen/teichoic acid export membrane protein
VQLKHLFQGSVKKVSVIFTLRIFGAILSLGFQALLARVLGAEKTGIYFLTLTFATTGMILSRVGLDNFLLRSISRLADQKDYPRYL